MKLFDLSGQGGGGDRRQPRHRQAICLRLAEHGARVSCPSRKLDACQAVVDEIRPPAARPSRRTCHIARKEELKALIDSTNARWGKIDVMVANAAINPYFGPAR